MSTKIADVATALFVPGDRSELMPRADASGADLVVIDLEDAVADVHKAEGRRLATEFLGRPHRSLVAVRINGADTPHHDLDLAHWTSVARAEAVLPDAIMLAKAQSTHVVERLADEFPLTPVICLIESAAGLSKARALAQLPNVARLAFGAQDFCLDLDLLPDRADLAPAWFELILASRCAQLPPPLASPPVELRGEAVADQARHARAAGFGGMLCIHPAQIAPVARAFIPTMEEIVWAREVVQVDSLGTVAGRMVDRPVIARARRILDRVAGDLDRSDHDPR